MAKHITEQQGMSCEKEFEDIPSLMNACLFYGPYDVRYERIPVPKINDNEILVKIKTALTCGTDLKTFQRSHPVLIKAIPSTFGHQFSGVVAKVGRNLRGFYPGQKIVALNSSPCFKCTYCTRQQFSLCENIEFLNGAYAEYITVPERIVQNNIYELPENIDFDVAAMLESLSVVVHGYNSSEITSDKTICIIGNGAIGLLFIVLAKLNGVKVISIGRKEFKLKIAKDLGADHILNSTEFHDSETLIKTVNDLTYGGPDVVIEAVGQPHLWELATKLVRRGGLVNFFGGCVKGSKVELDTYRLHYDELKLIGVFHHTPKYVRIGLDLLSKASFRQKVFEKIITHTVPLRELENAFLMHQSGNAIQVAVKP